jgi:hypothetical protein
MADKGHAKVLESLGKLIAFSETLDQTRLNPPPELTLEALTALRTNATALQTKTGNSKADWRTSTLKRAAFVKKLASLAAQAVAQLEARGASAETVEDARGYVRKLQGKRAAPAAPDNPETAGIDESAQGISASQQSSAAQIANFHELIDFLEAQPNYAGVTKPELLVANLRSIANMAQTLHDASFGVAASLANDRIERNKAFYLEENNICDLGRRFKNLVKGEYGINSPEFNEVNSIPFRKSRV